MTRENKSSRADQLREGESALRILAAPVQRGPMDQTRIKPRYAEQIDYTADVLARAAAYVDTEAGTEAAAVALQAFVMTARGG